MFLGVYVLFQETGATDTSFAKVILQNQTKHVNLAIMRVTGILEVQGSISAVSRGIVRFFSVHLVLWFLEVGHDRRRPHHRTQSSVIVHSIDRNVCNKQHPTVKTHKIFIYHQQKEHNKYGTKIKLVYQS